MDESDRIIDLYQRHAAAFDQQRSRSLFERPWLDRFLTSLPPTAPCTILDLGCGSGEPIARYLIEQGCHLTGVDASPQLLARARQRFPDHTWLEHDMRQLALNQHFAGLIAWDSFFHLAPDAQRAMFPLFRAHAAPGGTLLLTTGPAAGIALGDFEGDQLYHASLSPDEYRDLLDEHGFEVLHHVAEDRDCAGHTVWLAKAC